MSRRDKFKDRDYRAAYAESVLDTAIATQIRVLREQRDWSQERLAEAAGMQQSRISALEDANYSGWSIKTLKRLARAFDVPLLVEFGTFGRLLNDVDNLRRASLERPSFADDPKFSDQHQTPTATAAHPVPNVVSFSSWKGREKQVPVEPTEAPHTQFFAGVGTARATVSSEFITTYQKAR